MPLAKTLVFRKLIIKIIQRNIVNKYSSTNAYLSNRKTSQSGFSLIEVMIAAVILSIGILGVAGLQIVSLKGTHQSYMKDQAANLVHELTERMHSNKQAVINGSYVIDSNTYNCTTATLPACIGSGANCNSADVANYDLNTLICGYKAGGAPNTGGVKAKAAGDIVNLVGGRLQISCLGGICANGNIQIVMEWDEQDFDARETASTVKDSIVLNTRIAP